MILVWDCVTNIVKWHLCYQSNIIGMGTTDGMYPTHICYKEGSFLYEPDKLNMFIWLEN
jgi:hypothetical protein